MADARDFHALKHLLGILEGELRQQDLIALCERHDSGRRIDLDAIEIDLFAGDLVGVGHNFADVDAEEPLTRYRTGQWTGPLPQPEPSEEDAADEPSEESPGETGSDRSDESPADDERPRSLSEAPTSSPVGRDEDDRSLPDRQP